MDSSFPRRNPSATAVTDTVYYAIYSDDQSLESLQSLHLQILNLLSPLLTPHIWQHDPFHLTPTPHPIPHLLGHSRFGDNLDDEWFIVHLLFTASRQFPNASFRVWDSDGDFLLIESAFHLPRWLNPDNSENRVFIRNGALHIIPRSVVPHTPTLKEALSLLVLNKYPTIASVPVQNAIMSKLSSYPPKMHCARAILPVSIAQVLKHEPCLISLAVEGFYDRDIDSMKFASKMERFGEMEMVRVGVRMSRAMYGQLVQQRFQAPRGYPMPSREEGPVVGKEAELGLKIACGFEMMYQERKRAGEEGRGGTWDAFLESLERSGCFEGLLPGSKEYKRVMSDATEYYKKSSLFSRTRDMMNAPVRRIDEILSLPYSINDFEDVEVPANDDDSWMYNGEDELNSAIFERQKEMESYESERSKRRDKRHETGTSHSSGSQSNDFNLGDIAETMQAFVRKLSSFEGAEVPEHRTTKEVQLDADQFMKEMESVLGPALNGEPVFDVDAAEHTSSSDMDFGDSEDESDIDEHDDNEPSDAFMQSYSDALSEELNGSTLKRSFTRADKQSHNPDEGTSEMGNHADDDLTPVDVDLNLVKSFLESFSSQQGLPGPASNLLGLMGLEIPPDAKK